MNLAVICGSVTPGSANAAALAVATQHLATQGISTTPTVGIETIPVLSADLADDPPASVAEFRSVIEASNGILLASPEYAGGVAGGLKNALDWLVGSGSMYHKSIALMSAGTTGGENAIEQLVRTVSWQGGLTATTLGISSPLEKMNDEHEIVDEATIRAIHSWTGFLIEAINGTPKDRLKRLTPIVKRYGIDPKRFGDLKY